MNYKKAKYNRNAVLLLLTGLVGFAIAFAGAMEILFLLDFPAFRGLVVSAVLAALCTVVVLKIVEKKMSKGEEDEKTRLRHEREADTQKQIDTMLRRNSKIPKVKR